MDALFVRINRKKKGLTQKELGGLLEVSRQVVNCWENGKRNISKKNKEKIKKYLTNKNDVLKMQ